MKTEFTSEEKPELIQAARLAAPESEGLWDRLAEFFDHRRGEAEAVVEPRSTKP